jgi:putative transposase
MCYSTDLRETVLKFIDAGNSIQAACKLFVISRSSIQRWRLRLNDTGVIVRKPRTRSAYKVNESVLEA